MTNATSVKAKLRNVAEKESRPFDYILMHYFVERLLYRLSISTHADNFILKGGMLLYAMLDNDARATKDVDFLIIRIKNTQEELARVFTEICNVSSDDAIVFDASSITTQKIKEDADYEGVRVKITGYLDKTRQVLQFDIGYGDAVVPHPLDIDYPSLLGMERPHLKAYSKESFIAEKFEAMLALADANSRMKDFYDIYTLCSLYDFNGEILSEAIQQTLTRRGTPLSENPTVFSLNFPQDKNKQVQWRAFQKRIEADTDITFEEALSEIKEFLMPIYMSILNKNRFTSSWSSDKGTWTLA
ncbi:nucleotidyl transferase AbiEii/AbiGii toxin family protein [Christensenellaceae bacterium OttesenSCG-928-K19]|nr:nucleotidyl transferase AbiEii/AbiGii toxin family protein [Christensenellaceae bacterium OttesenSCG-928-K19]